MVRIGKEVTYLSRYLYNAALGGMALRHTANSSEIFSLLTSDWLFAHICTHICSRPIYIIYIIYYTYTHMSIYTLIQLLILSNTYQYIYVTCLNSVVKLWVQLEQCHYSLYISTTDPGLFNSFIAVDSTYWMVLLFV